MLQLVVPFFQFMIPIEIAAIAVADTLCVGESTSTNLKV
jgi:hypothetical protein